jgi:hypothetical protein
MVRGPDRPISFEKARRLLWERLAANAGVDLNSYSERDREQLRSEGDNARDEQLEGLWADADITLTGWIVCEELHWWVDDNGSWSSGTREGLKRRLLRPRDEPKELYVDRDEMSALMPRTDPDFSRNSARASVMAGSDVPKPNRRGRPAGSGSHDKSDAPLLKEMGELMEANPELSLAAASLMVVDRAKGTPNIENRAKRLCRKFKSLRRDSKSS